jgi:hypothetical protein
VPLHGGIYSLCAPYTGRVLSMPTGSSFALGGGVSLISTLIFAPAIWRWTTSATVIPMSCLSTSILQMVGAARQRVDEADGGWSARSSPASVPS